MSEARLTIPHTQCEAATFGVSVALHEASRGRSPDLRGLSLAEKIAYERLRVTELGLRPRETDPEGFEVDNSTERLRRGYADDSYDRGGR